MANPLDERKRALEEDYFRRKEQELIEKMRERMKADKEPGEAESGVEVRSLQCPRGDGALVEVGFENIRIDICETCGGAWLDKGELETLTNKESGGWLNRLWSSSGDE